MTLDAFCRALSGSEEVIVTSREDGRERSVRAWYAIEPPGVIYLFAQSFALRVARWREDPWVRLTVPGGGPAIEGVVHPVSESELSDSLITLVMDRWWMWGATTPEGLRRMIRDQSNVLFRVDVT